MANALFILDFDYTISQEHIHNVLTNAIAVGLIGMDDEEAQWNFIKTIPPTGTKLLWRHLFQALDEAGFNIAIASFSDYKTIIERYLREKIGVPDAIMEKIFIEAWLPFNPMNADKTQHIKNIIEHFHYAGAPNTIVLIDDSIINLNAAKARDYRIIPAKAGDKVGQHITAAIELISELKQIN